MSTRDQDELQKAAEEQRRHEEKQRLFKLEEVQAQSMLGCSSLDRCCVGASL